MRPDAQAVDSVQGSPSERPVNSQDDRPRERVRCYGCYRPVDRCFCGAIPEVNNRTRILLLQHMRERFHAFNTARIVKQSLQNCRLIVDHNLSLAKRLLTEPLLENVGVLYPGEGGRLLSEIQPEDQPDQLIIIDGTWHHARALLRDIPLLNELPRYQIIPAQPGQYRIRREPNETALSTLEATVAALRAIEPETPGLDELVGAFNTMVEAQLAHPKADYGWRKNRRRSHNPMGVPRSLMGSLKNIVVAYGESEPGKSGCKRTPRGPNSRQPVCWVAKRLGDSSDQKSQAFGYFIQPQVSLSDEYLRHVNLEPSAWDAAGTVEQFRQSWQQFLRPDDIVVVYHNSTFRLLENVDALPKDRLVLKSVNFDPLHQHATLDAFLESQRIDNRDSDCLDWFDSYGRSSERLANAIAMVRYLNSLSYESR